MVRRLTWYVRAPHISLNLRPRVNFRLPLLRLPIALRVGHVESVVRGLLFAAACCVAPPHASADDANEIIRFESLTLPGGLFAPFAPPLESASRVTVLGFLRLPPGDGKVPAVVLMHGCGGIGRSELFWARELRDRGMATFLVNSFSARGISQICTGRFSINMGSVLADAFGALRQLAQVSRIDIERVAIMGFSFGGRTALWTAYPSLQARYGEHAPRFAAHLGMYPGACYVELADEARIGEVPIRIFHGTADDWTPVEACREYVARLHRAGKDAALFEYANAGHSFDNDTLPSHLALPDALNTRNCVFVERAGGIVDAAGRLAGVDSPCYARGASIGYSADARRQAVADVHAFLRARFGSP